MAPSFSDWLRYLKHPVMTARFTWAAVRGRLYRGQARRLFSGLRRGVVTRCWCGGSLDGFKWHASYGICRRCGTYVNRQPPLREELKRLYTLQNYWRLRERAKGFPDLEEREALYRADGRLAAWLELIRRFAPGAGPALEIGCAPGVLLAELASRGRACLGVEVDPAVAAWIHARTGLEVRAGLFPRLALPRCSLFLAFDVLEHAEDPLAFLKKASSLLKSGGTAILQTPVDRYGFEPPLGKRFDLFDDVEHLFIFTDKALRLLASRSGFKVVDLKQRFCLGGEWAVFRKP